MGRIDNRILNLDDVNPMISTQLWQQQLYPFKLRKNDSFTFSSNL